MIVRAKTKNLFEGRPLTERQKSNSDLNIYEMENGVLQLSSLPRRVVFELTNACNLNCKMCGRNAVDFKTTILPMEWFEYFEKMFDIIEEVTLMGWGEPTVHPRFADMLRLIDKHSARKYFCTNGMKLDTLKDTIFETHVDVFAVSIDGGTANTNNDIRRGSDYDKIMHSLKEIVKYKTTYNLKYPWINFVFCAMKTNINELPLLVEQAHRIGINEVKVVYLTAFDNSLNDEVLWGQQDLVREVFEKTIELGEKYGVLLKLPHIQGEDPAGSFAHKDCFVSWRDFFLGSDGYIRPCMSTPVQFGKFDINKPFKEIWNSDYYIKYREFVNTPKMDDACKSCYQSSHCNWNKKETWVQSEHIFAPEWKK